MNDLTSIVISIEGAQDSDDADLAKLVGNLRQELLQLDVEDVSRLQGDEVPEGSRAFGAESVGALLVKLGPTAARKVVQVVQQWLSRSRARSAEVVWQGNSLKVTGISADEQERLISTWLSLVDEAQPKQG